MKEEPTIIIGTIGTDVHSWGMRFIEYALKQEGFKVVSLGVASVTGGICRCRP